MTDPTTPPVTTTDAGIPAPSDEHSLSVGPNGPLLMHDHYVIQKMAQFNRERVPERVVHAKGGGAHGHFEVIEDLSAYTKADFLSAPGKVTPLFARFSTVAGELGSADTARDPRGFSVKFYTDEGNYDLVGNNTPIFFMRDPSKFQDFIRSQKRMGRTHMRSHNAQWDFWSLSPESIHQVMILMSDRGTPKTWQNMNGYGSHTFTWVNAAGEASYIKYHFKTDQGIENFTDAEAGAMAAEDPDFHLRSLYDSIERGENVSWTLRVQIMPVAEAEGYRFNPFDLTKVWPHGDYPLHTVGRMVLDRNPENYFAEVEQAAFEPANMVPGIEPSPDKMLLGRMFSYPDAHRYRIGTNYLQLPINRPKSPVNSYNKDGAMRYDHAGDQPPYAPNSYGGPVADPARFGEDWRPQVSGQVGRTPYDEHPEDDDFGQPGTMWREVFDETARDHLVDNLVGHMGDKVDREVQERQVALWRKVDPELGDRVAAGLGLGAGRPVAQA